MGGRIEAMGEAIEASDARLQASYARLKAKDARLEASDPLLVLTGRPTSWPATPSAALRHAYCTMTLSM
jgi:hypothetical protein